MAWMCMCARPVVIYQYITLSNFNTVPIYTMIEPVADDILHIQFKDAYTDEKLS